MCIEVVTDTSHGLNVNRICRVGFNGLPQQVSQTLRLRSLHGMFPIILLIVADSETSVLNRYQLLGSGKRPEGLVEVLAIRIGDENLSESV